MMGLCTLSVRLLVKGQVRNISRLHARAHSNGGAASFGLPPSLGAAASGQPFPEGLLDDLLQAGSQRTAEQRAQQGEIA